MSKAINSPTARLLQSSRLFSIPRPLPLPARETASSTGVYRASDTATLPYPTHQAITTPASSHFRGDWGLKRALPRRATRETSTPHVRINAQDTKEHITDFESAAEHTRTEAKWQQMGIPMITKETRYTITNSNVTPKSVYDEEIDNTDPQSIGIFSAPAGQRSAPGREAPASESRTVSKWKYDGPWIAGMDEGEFSGWLETKIGSRAEEFRTFLFERLLRKRINEEKTAARTQGRTLSEESLRKVRNTFARDFDSEARNLRHDHMETQLSSEMTAAICDFLDLPSVQPTKLDHVSDAAALQNRLYSYMDSSGPPSTHPGAGLSHIRTNLVMENHPLYGPQANRSPVLARVVRARTGMHGPDHSAKIGVGGVVTNDSVQSAYAYGDRRSRSSPDPEQAEEDRYLDADSMVQAVDVDLERGNHIYVQTGNAYIDEVGRIKLDVTRGDKEAIAIKRGQVEPIHEARMASTRPFVPNMAPRGTAGNANYGTSLPDLRQQTRPVAQSRVQGFDEELSQGAQQGQMDEHETTAKIRSLLQNQSRGHRPSQGST